MLVIFDFDGTLADTWPWLARELVSAADRFGYRKMTPAEIEELRALDTRAIFAALEILPDRLPKLAAELRQRAEAEHFPLFDGVPDLIRTLHADGAVLAVVSSNSETAVRRALGPDLTGCISAYACAADVFGKAATFAEISRSLGVPASETVSVGDETRDLEAAREAGILGIAVDWGYADPDLLRSRAPGRVAGSVAELSRLIRGERSQED